MTLAEYTDWKAANVQFVTNLALERQLYSKRLRNNALPKVKTTKLKLQYSASVLSGKISRIESMISRGSNDSYSELLQQLVAALADFNSAKKILETQRQEKMSLNIKRQGEKLEGSVASSKLQKIDERLSLLLNNSNKQSITDA